MSICNIDICATRDSVPPGSLVTGPIGYVRLHGRNAEAWFDRKAPVERKYDYLYSESELEEWTARFLEGGENNLRSNPRDEQALFEAKIQELQAKVGELVLERDVLKKRWAQIQESREKTS